MAQECGFFNAELEGSEYDRVYNAEQFAAYFASFIANGVFGNSMGELVVLENQQANMSVDVSSGQGWINGWWYRNTEELNLPIALADGVLNRKDIVVLRWGNAERDMWLQVLQGEPSGEPIAPEIVRNADYYDLKLCEIDIPAGTSRITQSQITDTRLDNNVCGLVTGVVQQIDTTELYLQFRSQFEDFKDMSEEEFNTWFDAIKGQITTDLGIRLQLEIGDLSELETEDKTDLVSAINEAASKGGTPGVFYNTDDDAEADIANIPEGSMVYTNDGEDEPINARQIAYDDGTQAGSDVETQIKALYQLIEEMGGGGMPTLDYSNPLHTFSSNNLSYTATKDCYLVGDTITVGVQGTCQVAINGTVIGFGNGQSGYSTSTFIFTKLSAGDNVTLTGTGTTPTMHVFDTK